MSDEKFNLEKFAEGQRDIVAKIGFLEEYSMNEIKVILQRNCKPEFTKEYYPEHVITNGESFVVKWRKRLISIREEELEKIYGKP